MFGYLRELLVEVCVVLGRLYKRKECIITIFVNLRLSLVSN